MAMVICFWVLFSFRNNLCAVTLRKTVGGFETLASHCKKADWPTPCYSCGFCSYLERFCGRCFRVTLARTVTDNSLQLKWSADGCGSFHLKHGRPFTHWLLNIQKHNYNYTPHIAMHWLTLQIYKSTITITRSSLQVKWSVDLCGLQLQLKASELLKVLCASDCISQFAKCNVYYTWMKTGKEFFHVCQSLYFRNKYKHLNIENR